MTVSEDTAFRAPQPAIDGGADCRAPARGDSLRAIRLIDEHLDNGLGRPLARHAIVTAD